jgi:ribonuclease III
VACRHPLEPAVYRGGLVAKRSPGALAELYRRIGYKVSDERLIDRALTHASHGAAGRNRDYERLEFLGDRVLALVAAEELYRRFPDIGEGDLSRRLNLLVRQESCTEVAQALGLGEYIRWGTRTNDIASNPRVLADACEALIAAVYLDGGLDPARAFILRHWQGLFERAAAVGKDAKTALQEWALARGLPVPMYYEETRRGPDHLPVFVMMVEVEGHAPMPGEGANKRAAEQTAAHAFLVREGVWR